MAETDTRHFDNPYSESKPSQAEGERDQPGEEQREEDGEADLESPAKPSQAEGERKPYQ
jgi:hypothetical protein